MAKKSAASAKLKAMKPVKRPIEETFEEAKEMFCLTIEAQIKNAHRVDNLLNIRELAIKFWNDDTLTMDYFKQMQQHSISMYEKVLEASRGFELEDFKALQLKDYYADLVPSCDDIDTAQELFEAMIAFLSVQPYGQKMEQLHQMIQQEMADAN